MNVRIDETEIAERARRLRQEHNIQTYGVKDIFSLVAQGGSHLIRFPFGQATILGFATYFEGKPVIVSNSSEILSREIYTIAHELGHIAYDFDDDGCAVKIDKLSTEDSDEIAERRAYCFANCLLMPEEQLAKFVKYELKKDREQIGPLDIVRIQVEFQVSFAAAVLRLYALHMISPAQKVLLFDARDAITSRALFRQLDADESLLKPAGRTSVPPAFLEYVTSNYENGYIPYSSLEKALGLIGMDASVFAKDKDQEDSEDELNDIFQEST